MKNPKRLEQIDLLPCMGKWLLLASGVAALAGSGSALLLCFLGFVVFVVGWLCLRFGQHEVVNLLIRIELIEIEESLRQFLHKHADELRHVQVVLFRCELPI